MILAFLRFEEPRRSRLRGFFLAAFKASVALGVMLAHVFEPDGRYNYPENCAEKHFQIVKERRYVEARWS